VHAVGETPPTLVHLFDAKATQHPERSLLAQRDSAGEWAFLTYGEAKRRADAIASAFLALGYGPQTPLMILSDGSHAHAVIMLGAMKAAMPVVSVSAPYSLGGDFQ